MANLVPLIRLITHVRDSGANALTTTCSFCFNSLRRANYAMRHDPLVRRRVNSYLHDDFAHRDYEPDPAPYQEYAGELKVLHLLEVLRDSVGFNEIRYAVHRELSHVHAAPYYGCMLLRPAAELELDDPEFPTILSEFLLGCSCGCVEFPLMNECCGSYVGVSQPESSLNPVYRVLTAARLAGANAIVTTCPLCFYNLDHHQRELIERFQSFQPLPVVYFTQLLGLALGVPAEHLGFDEHLVDPRPLLLEKEVTV